MKNRILQPNSHLCVTIFIGFEEIFCNLTKELKTFEFFYFFIVNREHIMNRRSFFSVLTDGSSFRSESVSSNINRDRLKITSGLEPYTQPLDLPKVYHLLRRIMFSPTYAIASQFVGKTVGEVVDSLLGPVYDATNPEPLPTSPGTWVDSATENPDNSDIITRNQIRANWGGLFSNLQEWWIGMMYSETTLAREKLNLFWTGHLTTQFSFDDTFIPPQALYRQFLMIRSNRLGDFKSFIADFTLDNAMLSYLGGRLNIKGHPNENFGRELQELFTMGIGNYTEGDVKEAARVLTGWKSSFFTDEPRKNGIYNSYFDPASHDTEAKQYLGVSIPARDVDSNTEFLVKRDEIGKLISTIFEQRANAVGTFIGRKLYNFFVYSSRANVDANVLSQLSSLFISSNFQIRPVISTLLKSAHFFDDANVGVQIKTPAEYVVGLARQLGVSASGDSSAMNSMDQSLINPPNVAGWTGYHTWITTKTYPMRRQLATQILTAMSATQFVSLAKQFPDFNDADKLTTALEMYFLPRPVGTTRHQGYVATLLQNSMPYEWPTIMNDTTSAGSRIKGLISAFVKAPDFNLC